MAATIVLTSCHFLSLNQFCAWTYKYKSLMVHSHQLIVELVNPLYGNNVHIEQGLLVVRQHGLPT
jgi:hypothetical protein